MAILADYPKVKELLRLSLEYHCTLRHKYPLLLGA
jgi:hypothetical protein